MRTFRFQRLWPLLLVPLSVLLTTLAQAYPHITEQFYSSGVYRLLAGVGGRLFALAPFSIMQMLLVLLPVLLVLYVVSVLRARKPGRAARIVLGLLGTGSLLYFLFVLLCGLNYHRQTFAVHAGLPVRPSSAQELSLVCAELVENANVLAAQVQRDERGVMRLSSESFAELAQEVAHAYARSAQQYPVLGGYTPRAKPVLLPQAMSYLNLVGIYSGFTFEANVNSDVTPYILPAAIAHELAHYKGFMREEEANFIAYLVCRESGNSDLAYSGTLLALTHTSNALYRADRDLYFATVEPLDDHVRLDQAADAAYWSRFEGPAAEVSATVNDTYLKANRQSSGIKSYGQMVDLLLADYRARHGL